MRGRSESGQGATEYMLVIAVVVIAVVAAAYTFVPQFQAGINSLAADVNEMLDTGQVGEIAGRNRVTGADMTGSSKSGSGFGGAKDTTGTAGKPAPPSFGGASDGLSTSNYVRASPPTEISVTVPGLGTAVAGD